MMRTKIYALPLLALLVLSACGPGHVVVSAEVDAMDPDTGEQVVRPISNLQLQLVPFDRDFIFDSLTAAAPRPEPQLPQELVVARDSILDAQQDWREAESQWLALRDRLQQISTEMEQYLPAEARYRELFAQFDQAEGQYLDAERRKDEAFARFDRLQQATFAEMEQFGALVEAWEDDAFADWSLVVAERVRETGREILADTTDATGRGEFRPSPGQWWLHGRHAVGTEELYWNLPVEVERGDPLEVRLNRENAEIRPIY